MIQELQQLGFTDNEAQVYIAALSLGKCSVQQLANATGIKRLTVHSIVEKFESQQIFLRTFEGKRRRVTPVEPKQLLFIVKREQEEARKKEQMLLHILPSMEELYQNNRRGFDVKVLEGEEGFKFLADDVLTAKTEFLEYANIEALAASPLGKYLFGHFLPEKHKRKLSTKFLYPDTPASHDYIKKNYLDKKDSSPMEAKFISTKDFPFDDTLIVLYDDKVAMVKASTLNIVIINDREVSSALRAFFLLFWSQAGEAVRNT